MLFHSSLTEACAALLEGPAEELLPRVYGLPGTDPRPNDFLPEGYARYPHKPRPRGGGKRAGRTADRAQLGRRLLAFLCPWPPDADT
ncbi:hypothetical protein [Deinococcus hopiensis]|uniref:hypothetical protein n=1 Tax=Deinococcus hopiensis TaxID=309885 RepID=UPI00111C6BF6|nr:hypothetical protein [Deinococcus hopiensis]